MIHYLKRTEGILLLFQMLTGINAISGNSVSSNESMREEIIPAASLEFRKNNYSDSNTSNNIDQDTTSNPITTTAYVRHSVGRALPRFHLTESRWGPFFEGGSDPYNITAKVGSTVMMDCRIGLLQNKTVTWSHHKEDSFHLLTVGRSTYSRDERITLSFRYPNNFRLQIVYVTRRDQGLYECQVATHPPKVKRVFLKVIAPEVVILDEFGRIVTERYYRAGSDLELICSARQLRGSTSASEPPLLWKRDDRVLTKGISLNVSDTTDSATSSLIIAPLDKHHSGNYTCSVGSLAFSTVVVHVLNGELPAAVHFGNSASGEFNNALVMFGSIFLAFFQR